MFGSSESAVKSLLSDVETCNRLTLANHEGLKSSAPYGPEDESLDWDAINWPLHEDNVGRLRDRIFTATKDGDWSRVRNLQKIMLRSWSNTLILSKRAAGDAAQRWPQDRRDRRGSRADLPARMDLAVHAHCMIRSRKPLFG
jgi:RNA-directed DNA polymerase